MTTQKDISNLSGGKKRERIQQLEAELDMLYQSGLLQSQIVKEG